MDRGWDNILKNQRRSRLHLNIFSKKLVSPFDLAA